MNIPYAAGLRAGRGKRQFCLILAVVFLIGIAGNLNGPKSLSPVPCSAGQTMLKADGQPTALSGKAVLSAVESGGGIDDFHASVSNRRANRTSEEAAREIVFVLFAALLLSGFAAAESHRRAFDEKRISVFRVVLFIHRTDGKKRLLF